MAKSGKILEKDLIEQGAYEIGVKFGKSLDPANAAIEKFEKNFLESMEVIKKASLNQSDISSEFKNGKGRSNFIATKQKEIQLTEQVTAAYKEQDRTERNLITAIERKKIATESTNRALIKQRFETQQYNKSIKDAAVLSSKLSSEYQKLVVRYNQAGAAVQSLNAKKLQGKNLSDKEQQELKQSTADFLRYQKAVLGADESIGRFNRNVGNYPKGLLAAGNAIRSVFSAFGLAGGLFTAVQILKDAFNTIKEFNSGILNVSKTTGIAGKELDALSDDIIKLSNNLENVGTKALLEYATVAGQLGVKGSANILLFSESLAKLATASNITGEEGGAAIARILTLTDGGVQNIRNFSDELVKLGNNFAASESEIVSNATAIAQNTGVYKLGRQEVLAYAVATKAVGIEAEITGSTIGRTFAIIERAVRTGEGLEQISKLTAIAQEDLGKAFKENSGDVLTKLIQGLNGVDKAGGSVNEQLEILGISAVRDQRVIGTLATAGYDVLAQSIKDVTEAAGAADEEFRKAQGKLENQLKRITTAWDNFILSIEDGKGVLGSAVKGFADSFVGEIDRTNLILNSNISTWDRWKVNINNAVGNLSLGYITPFENSTKVLIANTRAITANTIEIESQAQAYSKQLGSIGPLTRAQQALTFATSEYFGLINQDGIIRDTESEVRSISVLRNEISKLNDAIETSDATDKAGIRTKQDKIVALQRELDAILGVTKATKQMNDVAIGSIAFMEQEVALLKTKQSSLATTSQEYFEQEKKIRKAQEAVKDFKDEVALLLTQLDGVNAGLNMSGDFESSIQKLSEIINSEDFGKDIKKIEYSDVFNTDNPIDKDLENWSEGMNSFVEREEERLNRISELQEEFADRQKELESGLADASIDIVNNLFDAKAQRYEDDINKNNDYYAALLANEELTQNQRDALEAERDRKNLILEKKKREEEKKAAIFNKAIAIGQITIKTAQTIAAINLAAQELNAITFGTAGSVFAAVQIPLAIALGAAQIGSVLSVPLPKYAQGKGDYDNYNGPAIWGEKRREVKISKDGSIEFSPKKIGNHLTNVKSDDIIHPDANKFLSDYEHLMRASILASVDIDNSKLKSFNASQSFAQHDAKLIKEMQLTRQAIERNKTKIVLPKQKNVDFAHELFRAKKSNWDI